MRIWGLVENKRPLQALEVTDPIPEGTEVVVAVSHCGVCHSDLHFWDGEYHLGRGKVIRLADRGVTLPRAPGHEITGKVVALGPDADGVKIGDRRIVYPWIGCGSCDRCLSGESNMCARTKPIGVVSHGGLAAKVVVPHSRFLVDPGDLDPAVAATYACSGITVYSAIRKLEIQRPDSPVVLFGSGGLGLSAIAMLKALGHNKIISVDIDSHKRQSALDAGASAFVDGNASDLVAELKRVAGEPLHYAIDFVNATSTARAAFDCLDKGGRLVLVGIAGGELELSLAGIIFVPRSVIGTSTGSLQDLKDVIALAQSGKLKPIPIERMNIDQANEALMRLKNGRVTGRIVLEHLGQG